MDCSVWRVLAGGSNKIYFALWCCLFGRGRGYNHDMRSFTAIIERDADTGLLVGHVPGFPGAHSQGETLDELNRNLREVIEMLLEEGQPRVEAEFVGTQLVTVG